MKGQPVHKKQQKEQPLATGYIEDDKGNKNNGFHEQKEAVPLRNAHCVTAHSLVQFYVQGHWDLFYPPHGIGPYMSSKVIGMIVWTGERIKELMNMLIFPFTRKHGQHDWYGGHNIRRLCVLPDSVTYMTVLNPDSLGLPSKVYRPWKNMKLVSVEYQCEECIGVLVNRPWGLPCGWA